MLAGCARSQLKAFPNRKYAVRHEPSIITHCRNVNVVSIFGLTRAIESRQAWQHIPFPRNGSVSE